MIWFCIYLYTMGFLITLGSIDDDLENMTKMDLFKEFLLCLFFWHGIIFFALISALWERR